VPWGGGPPQRCREEMTTFAGIEPSTAPVKAPFSWSYALDGRQYIGFVGSSGVYSFALPK
jgi:hypothetical protein